MTFSSYYPPCLRLLSVIFILGIGSIAIGQVEQEPVQQQNYYIKSVFFGGGSYSIDTDQRQEVIDFILEIEDLREYEIILHGHTDNIGSLDFNQWLSEMRSSEVLDILGEIQFNQSDIIVHDFGEESPYYSNQTWEGKLSNRRVDLIIQKIIM